MAGRDIGIGDVVSRYWPNRTYRVAKVLAVEAGGIHLRTSVEVFTEQPRSRPDQITRDGQTPLRRSTFEALDPLVLRRDEVHESDLAGYRCFIEEREHGATQRA